jgi:hypothetical protein
MKHTPVLLALFLIAFNGYSDVIIQRGTFTARFTGQGIERTLRFKEIIVSDLDSTNGTSIITAVINGNKIYSVSTESTKVVVETLRGVNGRVYTVIAQGVTETNDTQVLRVDGLLVKGLNTMLPVSESRQLNAPRVLRGAASRLEYDSGEFRLMETSNVRKFSQTETRAANASGEDVDTVVAKLIQRLEDSGYVLTE